MDKIKLSTFYIWIVFTTMTSLFMGAYTVEITVREECSKKQSFNMRFIDVDINCDVK